MASFPQNSFQQFLQLSSSQPQQSKPYRDMYNNNLESQISEQPACYNTPNLPDHHPPYIPPFQVAGLASGPAHEESGPGFGIEPKRKRPTEQAFMGDDMKKINNSNNSHIASSLDLFQAPGLGLSLGIPRLSSSLGDSAVCGLVGEALDQELQRQNAEIDRYIKLQGERLRRALLDKLHAAQLRTVSYIEDKIVQKLREKDSEAEAINRKNAELELRVEQLAFEAHAWQQRATRRENTIRALKLDLQEVCARGRGIEDGQRGDSEIDDTASCCNGRPADSSGPTMMTCRECGVGEPCMLLLPCKHLCLCRGCEGRVSICPICRSEKYIGMEVYM